MTRRSAAILLLLLAAAVGALLLLSRPRSESAGTGLRQPRPFLRVSPAQPGPGAAGPSDGGIPGERVRVTLFFPSERDAKLRPEERDIPKPERAGAFLRTLFAELRRGPTREGLVGALPQKLQLRNAFLLPDGEAVLDLAMDSGLSFGSAEELTIVASLVNTILQNVAATDRVRILVNGEPAETLGGHVDLTRPLLYLRREIAP